MNNFFKSLITWLNIVFDNVKLDMLTFFRQKLVFISSLLTPVSMLLAFGFGTNTSNENYFSALVAGIFGMSIMFSCFYSMGYSTISEKGKRTIEDIVLSPKLFSSFLCSKYLSIIIQIIFQLIIIVTLAVVLFHFKINNIPIFIYSFINLTIVFSSLGMIIGLFNNELSFSGIANFILMPLLYFGGVFFPIENFGYISNFICYIPFITHTILFKYSCGVMGNYNIPLLAVVCFISSLIAILTATKLFKFLIKNM